jgi:hypothetical protein
MLKGIVQPKKGGSKVVPIEPSRLSTHTITDVSTVGNFKGPTLKIQKRFQRLEKMVQLFYVAHTTKKSVVRLFEMN